MFADSYRRTDGDLAPLITSNQVELEALNRYDLRQGLSWLSSKREAFDLVRIQGLSPTEVPGCSGFQPRRSIGV